MGADTVIPPLPPGFQLESSSTNTLPPLPPGFQLEQRAQGNVPLTSLTGQSDSNIPAFTQGKPPSLLDKIGQLLHPQPDALAVPPADVGIAGPHLAGLFRPPSAIEQMKPGIGKALGEQLTLPNIALLGAGGPAIHAMLQSPLGKAVLAVISAKFAQKGAEEAGTAFGKASTEPAGGQRRYDITQGVIGAAQTLPVLGAPFYRETPGVSGLNREDVPNQPVYQMPNANIPAKYNVSPRGTVMPANTPELAVTGQRTAPSGTPVRESQGPIPMVGENLLSLYNRAKTSWNKLVQAANKRLPGVQVKMAPRTTVENGKVRPLKPSEQQDIFISDDGKTLHISQSFLDDLQKLYPGREEEALNAALDEESIHHEQINKLGEGFQDKLSNLWKTAPENIKSLVRSIYGGSPDMQDHHWGAELLRMGQQAATAGRLTESIHPLRGKVANNGIQILSDWFNSQGKNVLGGFKSLLVSNLPLAFGHQPTGEPKQGGQISFAASANAGSVPNARQSAIVPAVQTDKGTLVAKPNEITHADVLQANGINPESIPHEDPRRGFVDTKSQQFLNRQQAEQATGIKGTAKAGGLDSMDLPRAKGQELPPIPQGQKLVTIQRPDKSTYPAIINDPPQYYDFPGRGQILGRAVAKEGKWSHGMLGEGEKVLEQEQEQPLTKESELPNENKSQQEAPVQRSENEHGEASHDQSVAQSGGESQQEAVPERSQHEQQSGLSESGDVIYPIGQGPQALHSGLPLPDWDGRKFVSQAEKFLRDPKLIGFAGEGQVDSQQLKNRLRNKLGEGSGEWKMLQDLGVDKFLDSGKKTPNEVADWVKENGPKVEVRKFGMEDDGQLVPRKGLIFRTPSGQPKTDITARMFSIAKPTERLASGEPFSTTGRLYGGIPFLDPEFWKSAMQNFGTWDKKSGKDKDPSTRPLGWNPMWDLSPEQRAKEVLENPTAKKLEDFPQLRGQPGESSTIGQNLHNHVTSVINTAAKGDKIVFPNDVVLDMIGGGNGNYDSPVSRLFGWTVDDAMNREEIGMERVVNKLKPLQKNFTQKNKERIKVYADAMQEGGRDRLKAQGVTEETINKILKTITPAEKAWYDQSRKMMDEFYPYLRNLAKSLYGIDLPYVKNYFPWLREHDLVSRELPEVVVPKGHSSQEDLIALRQLMADFDPTRKGTKTQQGFLINRVPNSKTATKMDAIEVANRFFRDALHFITHQKLLEELGGLARSDKFKEKYGENSQRYIVNWLNTVARQGRFMTTPAGRFLQWLRKNTNKGILAYRPATMFVHASNVPLAMYHAGPKYWWSGLNAALTDEGQAFLSKHFKETFIRGGGEPTLLEEKQGPVTRGGFWLQRVIDKYNAQATSLGVYQRLLEESGKNPTDYDTLPVNKDLVAKARVLSRRAVASPLPKDIPEAIGRGSQSSKAFFQFQNTFLDQWSNIRYDFAETGISEFVKQALKGSLDSESAKRVAGLAAALTAMFFIETSIRYEANEVEKRATGHGPQAPEAFWSRLLEDAVKRVPIVGQGISMAKYGETGVPSLDVIKDAVKSGQSIYEAFSSGEPHKEKEAMVKTATSVGEVLGVPGIGYTGQALQDYMTSSPGMADRSQMYQAARKWMQANGKRPDQPGLESQYLDLNNALAKGDMNEAQAAYKDLQGKVKVDQIKHYYQEYPERKFTGNTTNEAAFYSSLTPEQKQVYNRTKQGNEEVQARFFSLINEKVPEKKKEARTLKNTERLKPFRY